LVDEVERIGIYFTFSGWLTSKECPLNSWCRQISTAILLLYIEFHDEISRHVGDTWRFGDTKTVGLALEKREGLVRM